MSLDKKLGYEWIDWSGTPVERELLVPKTLVRDYTEAINLYRPSDVILHVRMRGGIYVTTYVPRRDFDPPDKPKNEGFIKIQPPYIDTE